MGNKFINLPVINSTSSTGTERFQLYRSEKILRFSFQKKVQWNLSFVTPLLREHHHSMETTLFPEKCSYNLCICNSIKGPSLFRGNGPFFEDPKVGFNHSHESTCKTSKNQSDITTGFLSAGYFEKIEGTSYCRSRNLPGAL